MKRFITVAFLLSLAPILSACPLATIGGAAASLGVSALTMVGGDVRDAAQTDIRRQLEANAKQDDRVAVATAACFGVANTVRDDVDKSIESFRKCLDMAAEYQPVFLAEQVIARIRARRAEREAAKE